MPPQTPNQATSAVPPQPATAPNQNTELLAKKIHNAGQSVFLLGCFLAFIGIVSLLGLNSIAESKRVGIATYILMFVAASVYWVIAGLKIKRSTNNVRSALSTIQVVLITALVVSAISILVTVIGGKLGAGDFTIVLALYLLVAQAGIKKLST